MKSPVVRKIVIVLIILVALSLLIRMIRFFIPILIIAVVIGYLWDWMEKKDKNKFDKYEEM